MNISPQVKNHSQGLKVNRKVNHLIPPYKQTTPQEQKRFEKSRQLPIVPILQPTPEQLLQQNIEKIRQVVKPVECDIFIAPHAGMAKCDVELVEEPDI